MKPPLDKAPPPSRGSIRRDEITLFAEAARRLGSCAKSRRKAARRVALISYGRYQYVLGADVLDFFLKLAEQQAAGNDQEQKGGDDD